MSETSPITEQANPETELARDLCSPEDLPHDALQTIPRKEPVVQVSEQLNAQLENLYVGAGRTQVEDEEEKEEEDVVNDSGRLVKLDAGGSSSGGLKRIPSMTRGFSFPVSSLKPVGQAFENNRKMIWSWLMNDEISTIGICGMGGIGKTTILKHINNKLLQRPDISRHVYWVTVSQDFSIYRLQNLIAKHLDLDLSSEYNILPRAAKLSEELTKKQEWILILDDLWESFELSAVGIPVPLKGCKVIITTRSYTVCQQMGSQVITKVRPLSEIEAWTLFIENLGYGIRLSPEMKRIAVDIARECAGLPLGIITMARSLMGEDNMFKWRNTLRELKGSESRDMENEVFRVLRFSYDRLDDVALQQCLLYCALFPEGHEIEREELIFYLIDKGIIENIWSREAAFDEGHAMLDRLESVCLLERIDGGRAVKMHDLVRDMAIRICKENPSVKIKDMAIRICKENPSVKIKDMAIRICKENPSVKIKDMAIRICKENPSVKIKDMAVRVCKENPSQMINSQPPNDQLCSPSLNYDVIVNYLQQREPMFTGEYEWTNDFIGGGIEVGRCTPETIPITEHANPETDHCSPEELPHDEFQTLSRTEPVVQVLEQSKAERDNLSVDAGRTQVGFQGMEQGEEEGRVFSHFDMENTGEGSVQHVDRIVPPTIDENYNRREATEILVQPAVCASAFVFYGDINAISTSQQEQNNEVDNVAGDEGTTPAAATRDHTPGRYFEEFSRWLMEDDEDEEPGEDAELLGPGIKRMAQLKSGWTLLMTSLIIEIASAVFDQLGYALVGMVLAFVALLVATADLLIHMAVKERMSLLPIFHRTSTATFVPGKPAGTIVDYFGFLGAVWQCFYSTVGYAYARQKKDNPIKMSLLPLIFFSCVVIYKLNEKSSLTRVLRKGIFLTLKKPLYSG